MQFQRIRIDSFASKRKKKKKDLPVNSYIYRLARTRKNSQNNLLRTVWNMCNISVCLYAILRYVT